MHAVNENRTVPFVLQHVSSLKILNRFGPNFVLSQLKDGDMGGIDKK
jgi:hypothetical protein